MDDVLARLNVDKAQIEAFCRKWKIVRMELFGSVLRDDFDERSDVDVLVTFAEQYSPSLRDLLAMEDELRAMFGRDVDIVKRHLVETSENWIRRRSILESAQPIYAAP